jgi:hypothetical protein
MPSEPDAEEQDWKALYLESITVGQSYVTEMRWLMANSQGIVASGGESMPWPEVIDRYLPTWKFGRGS